MVKKMRFSDIDTKQKNILGRRGITSGDALWHLYPRRFYDLTAPAEYIVPDMAGKQGAFVGALSYPLQREWKDGQARLSFSLNVGGSTVFINYFGKLANFQYYQLKDIPMQTKMTVYGKLRLVPQHRFSRFPPSYAIDSPPVMTEGIPERKMVPVYGIKGIADHTLDKLKMDVEQESEVPEYLPGRCLGLKVLGREMPTVSDAVRMLTTPEDSHELERAKKRYAFEDLLYYACLLEMEERTIAKGSSIVLPSRRAMNTYIESLPYTLTKGQKSAISQMVEDMENGRRLNDIVSADVGAGKTTIAFALMFEVCGNGHQAVLCAPTESVAQQHYEKLLPSAAAQGFEVVYLAGSIKRQKRKVYRSLLEKIASGEALMVVGTHSVFSSDVLYKDLALVITDEEHSFGVRQKEALEKKGAPGGVHKLSMSATLLPRTLFTMMFASSAKLISVESVPQGRLPVKTAITGDVETTLRIMQKTLDAGNQIYVVCPLVSPSEADTMDGVANVDETVKALQKHFPKEIIGKTTGKMQKSDAEKALRLFKDGTYRILVATTIISVGVDVPNATLMVIRSPERFGLATMHQTRGRVGRGSIQSYCILLSDREDDSERLQYFATHHDGAELAEKDAELRGKGNYLGTEQSGNNKYIALIEEQPQVFRVCRNMAKELLTTDDGAVQTFIEGYEAFHALDADVLAKEVRKKDRSS